MNSDLDDFDDHDFDNDDWGDELETSPEHEEEVSDSSKKSKIFPLIVIVGISGLGYLAYYNYNSGSFNASIPVVNIGLKNTPDTLTHQNIAHDKTKPAPLQKDGAGTEFIVTNPSQTQESDVTSEGWSGVLTPFPNEATIAADLDLPDLNNEESIAVIEDLVTETLIIDNNTSSPQDENAPPLEEEALLEKTELSFDEPILMNAPDLHVPKNKTVAQLEKVILDEPALPEKQIAPSVEIKPIKELPDENVKTNTEIELIEHPIEQEKIISQDVSALTPEKTEPKPAIKIAKKPYVAPAPKWYIRAAKTGHAVIVDKKTGNSLSIEVGSTVKGIGRVKSIENKAGKWVIIGINGKITQ